MRAGFASDYKPSSPHASALRLKVSDIGREPSGDDPPIFLQPLSVPPVELGFGLLRTLIVQVEFL